MPGLTVQRTAFLASEAEFAQVLTVAQNAPYLRGPTGAGRRSTASTCPFLFPIHAAI
jgi:hypothetical protein